MSIAKNYPVNFLSIAGCILAVGCVLSIALSGPGYRLQMWDLKIGIGMLKYAGIASFLAVALSLLGLILWKIKVFSHGKAQGIAGLVIGCLVAAWAVNWKRQLDAVPYIHDITTDIENPPKFEAVLPLRAGAANSAEYEGRDVAAQQKIGYPDLGPGTLSTAPNESFPLALQAAKDMGWEIVAAEPTSLRIEATDTTLWFGFKDDVVVRLSPAASGGGSRVDVRSVSRVGKSDVGTNAKRIKAYLSKLNARS